MAVHRRPPENAELKTLDKPRAFAITMYVETSPDPEGREASRLRVKSGFDEALRRFEAEGGGNRELEDLRQTATALNGDVAQLWGALERSLAVFVAPGFSEVFVVHNRLREDLVTGDQFALGQLYRTVSYAQDAFALTLSSDEWSLWEATSDARATKLDLDDDQPENAAEGSNRDTIGGRDRPFLSKVGDEGKKTFLDEYAKRVADAVTSQLRRRDVAARIPLFVFAAEPLLSMFNAHFDERRVVNVSGAPDRLNAAEIDDTIRDALADLDRQDTEAALRALENGDQGLVERDPVALGRAAAESAIETLYFDDAAEVRGRFNRVTGELEPDENARNALPAIAALVLERAGRVVAVRPDDLAEGVWQGPAIARLRFALT